jgi:hypothetical protein
MAHAPTGSKCFPGYSWKVDKFLSNRGINNCNPLVSLVNPMSKDMPKRKDMAQSLRLIVWWALAQIYQSN